MIQLMRAVLVMVCGCVVCEVFNRVKTPYGWRMCRTLCDSLTTCSSPGYQEEALTCVLSNRSLGQGGRKCRNIASRREDRVTVCSTAVDGLQDRLTDRLQGGLKAGMKDVLQQGMQGGFQDAEQEHVGMQSGLPTDEVQGAWSGQFQGQGGRSTDEVQGAWSGPFQGQGGRSTDEVQGAWSGPFQGQGGRSTDEVQGAWSGPFQGQGGWSTDEVQGAWSGQFQGQGGRSTDEVQDGFQGGLAGEFKGGLQNEIQDQTGGVCREFQVGLHREVFAALLDESINEFKAEIQDEVQGMVDVVYFEQNLLTCGSLGPNLNIKSFVNYDPGHTTVVPKRVVFQAAVSAFLVNGLIYQESLDFVVSCLTGMNLKEAQQKGFKIVS